MVGILETDETFRKKLEESNISDIKVTNMFEQSMSFVDVVCNCCYGNNIAKLELKLVHAFLLSVFCVLHLRGI